MKKYLLAALLVGGASAQAVQAQAPPSGGPPQPNANANAADVTPVDGGASLLLASGVAYGLQRLRQRRTAR